MAITLNANQLRETMFYSDQQLETALLEVAQNKRRILPRVMITDEQYNSLVELGYQITRNSDNTVNIAW